VFVAAAIIQLGLYFRLLREPLRIHDLEKTRAALKGWIKVAVVWQVIVLGACAAYLVALSSSHGPGIAWISPAVGAVLGTALPLQFVVMAILRSARS
jgi:uncharacterized membrane protein